MNLFKKIFGSNGQDARPQKADLMAQLENAVLPFLTEATKFNVQKASRPPEDSNLRSHFGGMPYFEEGRSWPVSDNGTNLNFVFQIFNTPDLCLPQEIRLIQFFYDHEEAPWSSEDDGWHIRIYENTNPDKVRVLDKPYDTKDKYCEIEFERVKSLPDWEGIDGYSPEASELCSKINDDEPWEAYEKVVQQLTGQQDYQSQLGGHPKWIQGESTPQDSTGKDLPLLFQIDSEENAGIMWGDSGMVYAFYDSKTKKVEFELQCY